MRRCEYCGQPFDPDDSWHRAAGLDRWCSSGCRYGCELPLSHAGQTFVTTDELPPLLAADTAHPADVMTETEESRADTDSDDRAEEERRRFAAALTMIARLSRADREIVIFRLINPGRRLKTYARAHGVSVQAASARLLKIYEHHPALRTISEP